MSASVEGSKKKSRRRLRVSCVECSRRRQKCDREQPCGLCKSRGVEHLCRWELEPFARPPPARPPGAPKATVTVISEAQATVQSRQTVTGSSTHTNTALGAPKKSVSPGESSVDQDIKEAAIALAQLSVAKQGEYLGDGSVVCALHRLDDSGSTQIPFDKSSGMPFSASDEYTSAIFTSFSTSLQALIYSLPSKLRCDALVTSFFDHDWRFCLPRRFIFCLYNRMWDAIQADLRSLNRIKVHWLTLLFAILAVSPECASEEESRKYFLQSLTSRRLAEDLFCASFGSPKTPMSVTEGTAQSCLATVLLANFLCDRGQVTEAWKMVGSAVRMAQNAGLHRNPAWNKWKDMTEEEQLIRRTAWLMLSQQDKFLSFILGRPGMIHPRDTDCLPPVPPETLAADGSDNTGIIYQSCLSSLIDIISEAKNKYLCVHPELYVGSANIEAELEAWKASLPSCFTCDKPDTSLDHIYPHLRLQRCSLAIHFFACCMLFHRSLPSARPPPLNLPNSRIISPQLGSDYNKLASFASLLLQHQSAMAALAHTWRHRQPCFTNTFLVFEAAVTLSIALCRDEYNPYAESWRKDSKTAIDMLGAVRENDSGDIVRQAILVLRVLQDPKPTTVDSVFKHLDFRIPNAPAPAPNESIHPWPQSLEMPLPTATSALPGDALHSIYSPFEWMADGVNGSVTAFNLLHSLDN